MGHTALAASLDHRSTAVSSMWARIAFLLLCGLSLGPAHAATFFDPRPSLWVEPESLQDPGANLTLVCEAKRESSDFQLFRNGVVQDPVRQIFRSGQYRFPLGLVTKHTRGVYRCRSGFGGDWTGLSELQEVPLPGSLPAPELTADGHSWTAPLLPAKLRCRAGLRGVIYELRREGDSAVQTARDPRALEAAFSVQDAGNYSCSYRTHEGAASSPPSASLEVLGLAAFPPPELSIHRARAAVVPVGQGVHLDCQMPLSGMLAQLLHDGEVLRVPMGAVPERTTFMLNSEEESGFYTCRYQPFGSGEDIPWSSESKPVELLRSDGSLPAPKLSAELGERPVRMRCVAPRSGFRFALLRGGRPTSMQSPEGAEAVFELSSLSVAEAGNYSCVYADPQPPFAGSQPSPSLELLASDPLPRPRLHAPPGPVTPGRDARLRCEGALPGLRLELLRDGEVKPASQAWGQDGSADLLLHNVGPQHSGSYSCRYHVHETASEPSEPVLLIVAGS